MIYQYQCPVMGQWWSSG